MAYKFNISNFQANAGGEIADISLADNDLNLFVSGTDLKAKFKPGAAAPKTITLGVGPSGLTEGSVLFGSSTGFVDEDPTKFKYDKTNIVFNVGSSTLTTAIKSAIIVGELHTIDATVENSTIISGLDNEITGTSKYSAIVGGRDHACASANNCFIGGGTDGIFGVGAGASGIVAGKSCTISDANSFIGGGLTISVNGTQDNASVGGSGINITSNGRIFNGGGLTKTISGQNCSSIGGNNITITLNGINAAACGGQNINISSAEGASLGGQDNTVSGNQAVTTFGKNNTSAGDSSWAAGTFAKTNATNTIMINLNSATLVDQTNSTPNSFAVQAAGGSVFGATTSIPTAELATVSTTKGVSWSPMTQAQRDAILTPPAGLMMYIEDLGRYNFRDSTSWLNFVASGTLTNTRIPFVNSSGNLTDDADLTFVSGSNKFVIGSGSNKIEVDPTNSIKLFGTARRTNSIVIGAQQMTEGGSPPATVIKGIALLRSFAKNKGVNFTIKMPEDYEDGTDLSVYYWWSPSAAGTEDIDMDVVYNIKAEGDIIGTAGTTLGVPSNNPNVIDKLQKSNVITLTGASITRQKIINIRFQRPATDLFAGNVQISQLVFEYTSNSLGK